MKNAPIGFVLALAAAPMTAPAQPAPVHAVAAPAPSHGLAVHNVAPTAPAAGIIGPTMHIQAPAIAPAVHVQAPITAPAVHIQPIVAAPTLHNPAPVIAPAVHNQPIVTAPTVRIQPLLSSPTSLNKSAGTAPQYHPTTNAPTYNSNTNGNIAYHFPGSVVLNPVLYGSPWGWNHGIVWLPQGAYWGGAFFGPFGPGAATTAEIMGSIIHGDQMYPSYGVSVGSPGALSLSNYGLHQVRCGTPGLAVIHGPNLGVVCAYPNARVGAGDYSVNLNTFTLRSL